MADDKIEATHLLVDVPDFVQRTYKVDHEIQAQKDGENYWVISLNGAKILIYGIDLHGDGFEARQITKRQLSTA